MMDFVNIFRLIVLFGLLGWAAWTDMRTGRIPNELTLTGIVVGIGAAVAADGLNGLAFSLWGVLAGGGPFLLFYLIGLGLNKPLMGAGDVKLMAAIGAFTGAWSALWCITYGLTVAGLVALGIVLYCGLRRRPFPRTIALGACLSLGTALVVLQQTGLLPSTLARTLGMPM